MSKIVVIGGTGTVGSRRIVYLVSKLYQHFLNTGLLAMQAEIDEPTAVLGHGPRSYEAFVKEVLPV